MEAGPVFNFILSILVFSGFLFFQGTATDPLTVDELRPMPGAQSELAPGDEILAIAGNPTPTVELFGEFVGELPLAAELEYRLRRDGQEITVKAPHPGAGGRAGSDANVRGPGP